MPKSYRFYGLIFILLLNSLCSIKATAQYDLLVRNVCVVDVINDTILQHRNIYIKGTQIASITDVGTIFPSKDQIDGTNSVDLPGFINTHTHLWQHISKSCYPKESLQEWIRVYRPIHYLSEGELYDVVLAASNEALLSGITSVSDYASLAFNDYAFDSNARAISDAGLGGIIVWHNPSIFLPDRIKIEEINKQRTKLKNKFDIWMGPGPLSFHSLPQVYSGIRLAKILKMDITEHTMENNQEQVDFYNRLKKYYDLNKAKLTIEDADFFSSILSLRKPSDVAAFERLKREAFDMLEYDSLLIHKKDSLYAPLTAAERDQLSLFITKAPSISPLVVFEYFKALDNFLSIHSVWLNQDDIETLKKNAGSVSHNPESNMYLTSGISPIEKFIASQVPVSLGTDGAASNDGINFFSAMREMWNVYKIGILNTRISRRFNVWEIIHAATINGAKAMKIDKQTGSIDIGKEADITLLSTAELGMSPLRIDKLLELVIYSAGPRNVKYVISNGQLVVKEGNLVKYSENVLAERLSKLALSVDSRTKEGKIWQDGYSLSDLQVNPYWYKYRSIRLPDSVNVSFMNNIKGSYLFSAFCSSATFGGGSPDVVDEEVAKRFPEKRLSNSFKEQFKLLKGDKVQILKNRGKEEFLILHNGEQIRHSANPKSIGQLLFLLEKVN